MGVADEKSPSPATDGGETWLEQGQLRLKLQDFAGAVTDYSAALRIAPSAAAYYGRAMAHLNLGQGALAELDALQALQLRPQWPAAHRLLGKAQGQQGQWAAAIAAYGQAIRHYQAPQDQASIDQCRHQIAQWQQHLTAGSTPAQPKTAPPLDPRVTPLGVSPVISPTVAQGTTDRTSPPKPRSAPQPPGQSQGQRGGPTPSSDPITQQYLRTVQQKIDRGDYQGALEDVNWVLQVAPQDLEVLAQRGVILGRLGRVEAALVDLGRVLQGNPHRGDLYGERGRLRLKLGDAQGAVVDFSRWLDLSPETTAAWVLRGQAQGQLAQWDAALADYDRALHLEPDSPSLQEGRGNLYEAQGKLTDAIAHYRQAASLSLGQGDRRTHDRLQQKIKTLQVPPTPDRIRVPIKYRAANSPVLEVVFQGRYPLDLVLDTGCTTTTLTATMARTLGLSITGRQYTRVADGRVIEVGTSRVDSIAVGEAVVRNLEVNIVETSTEGLLGQNFFEHFEMLIRSDEVEFIPHPRR
ncbi:tetratricopeptide repeat protein [Prochlorothrix hollandica]|uniref:Tetratricopeptide repeat protein n=1 Tax=Prochlorothrix hollandica PCC 9006 = CALU 1027 TaxID=317619 RepID=A0A0M2PUU8_PROHO|nr:tetratricopeptide repeat protein [Prochlorothrix hollandica]KKI98413.1 hypothetical protein PROH_18300 [Prochlorothrix hollandica PCC 9006 = CALU 1027]